MQENTLYRPYKFYKWIALFLLIFESLFMFLMILTYHFSTNLHGVFYLVLVSAFFIATATYFYIEYCIVILFGQSEIQIFENKVRKKYLWTNFSNAYYYRDVRLHRHFVLSNKELNKKEVCSICSNASFSNKYMFQDDVLVIHMSDERDRDMVEQEIKKHELLLQHINNL